MTDNKEFSVYWWDKQDNQYEELRYVSAQQAVSAFIRLTKGPASSLVTKRCIITDGGDYIAFEWKEGKLVYPEVME